MDDRPGVPGPMRRGSPRARLERVRRRRRLRQQRHRGRSRQRRRQDRPAAARDQDRPLRDPGQADLRAAGEGALPEVRGDLQNADQDAAKQQQQAEAALTSGAKVLVLDAGRRQGRRQHRDPGEAADVPVVSYDRCLRRRRSTTTSPSTTSRSASRRRRPCSTP